MWTRLQLFVWAVLAAYGISCYEENAADAAPAKAKSVAPATNGASETQNHQNHQTIASALHEMHQAKHLLDIALHDYHGHRAKADGEINKAIHVLEHHHHKGKSSSTGQPAAKAKTHVHPPHAAITPESQKESDHKLHHAEKLVHAAIHRLHHNHSQGKEHHHVEKAIHLLKEAAHEIASALQVVHHYHKHQQAALQQK